VIGLIHITTPERQQPLTKEVQGLRLDAESRSVKLKSKSIATSEVEFRILGWLIQRPERVHSLAELANVATTTEASARQALHTLRHKLDRNRFIVNRKGVGYSLVRP